MPTDTPQRLHDIQNAAWTPSISDSGCLCKLSETQISGRLTVECSPLANFLQ
jgi:hypothetical protein